MAEVKISRIVYKGAFLEDLKACCVIALGIPEDAQVVIGELQKEKERSNKAITLAIAPIKYGRSADEYVVSTIFVCPLRHTSAISLNSHIHGDYRYYMGHLQTPTEAFDIDPYFTYASGIHFFGTIQSAVKYTAERDWMVCCEKPIVEGTEAFIKFAKEQAERYNNNQSFYFDLKKYIKSDKQ
jgi:hypothetical protein